MDTLLHDDWPARLIRRFRPRWQRRFGPQPVGERFTIKPMRARDRLLLFVALEGAPEGLDPVRLQKGMFLFSQDKVSREDDRYEFVAYNYGPMSAELYRDLKTLEANGWIEAVAVQGQSWARYVATESGLVQARELLRTEHSEAAARRLHSIKREVASKSFSSLLDDVYDRYPEYASKSIFRRAS